ncbi:Ig-like domain-containing protein [uncultured Roseibium sp.]|uniref:Ig-like domain-containing protein n=1 Tax=uncultured Roseibium sp. TaxID=1936171 RepID=UPI003747C14B
MKPVSTKRTADKANVPLPRPHRNRTKHKQRRIPRHWRKLFPDWSARNGTAISLSALYTDADTADTHSFSIDTTGTAGLVTHNGDGKFSYETNGAFESLGAGQTATDSFTYTVTDSNGASSTPTRDGYNRRRE